MDWWHYRRSYKSDDCLLSIGHNTSALGWMRRSTFWQKEESDISWKVKQQLGRELAKVDLDADVVLYKQCFKGQDNVVADSHSRDNFYLNPNTHFCFMQLSTPPRQLPKEICCFIILILQQLLDTKLQSSQPKPSKLAHGNIGLLISLASGLKVNSSKDSTTTREIWSYQDLPKQLEKAPSLKEILGIWLREQSQPPFVSCIFCLVRVGPSPPRIWLGWP